MLIGEDFEQARVLVALLVSIAFLVVHLSVKPLRRSEDNALMTVVELALIVIYTWYAAGTRTMVLDSHPQK
jgi:hypothetical protein|eukprot:383606-Prymnesium_polylepis.3